MAALATVGRETRLYAVVAFDAQERRSVSISHFHGYDVGFVNVHWQLYSALLSDVLARDIDALSAYRGLD